MKRTVAIAIGMLATSTVPMPVQAQTNVAIFGILDAALVVERGGKGGSVTKLTSGVPAASRIGLRGTESLGADWKVFFTLEAGSRIDTGEADAPNTVFNRQAFLGIQGGFGALALGRQYTPYHSALGQVADPFGNGYAGAAKNLFPDSGPNVRTSNTISYASPNLSGFRAELAYSPGEQRVAAAGRQFGASLGYEGGPLAVRLAYNNRNTDSVSGATAVSHDLARNLLLAANVDLRWVKLYAAWEADKGFDAHPLGNANNPFGGVKPTPSADGRDLLLGLAAPLGRGTLMASFMAMDDKTAFEQDASLWGVGYLHPLSKRTGLYAAYAHIRNRNGAGYTVGNNSEPGSGHTAYNLGIRHGF